MGRMTCSAGDVAHEDVVDGMAVVVARKSEAGGGVGLGVAVDQEDLRPSRARQAARLMAVVVLPTPPFWLTTPRILPMALQVKVRGLGRRGSVGLWRKRCRLWKAPGADRGSISQAQ